MIARFFVYGTLKRGQCREGLWPTRPIRVQNAWTHGRLFGREDYPAMIAGSDRVLGECWQFEPDEVAEVLKRLDQIEGTNQPGEADLYVRQQVPLWDPRGDSLGKAWTYLYATDPVIDGFHPMPSPATWPAP